MTQHTQGPWTLGVHKVNSQLVLSNGRAIAAVQCGELDSEANARLIAASPTLYQYALDQANNGCEKAKTMLASLDLTN